jgi:DNA-binding LytR/AlgR family response regulator
MSDVDRRALSGHRLLVVEDDYLIAADMVFELEQMGATIVGPVATVAEALRLVNSGAERLDGAILDVNLRDERVYPVADALADLGVRFVFTTGYDAALIAAPYADIGRCEKPVDARQLARLLVR